MQPQILINTQYIKDFSLEIPGAPEIFKHLKSQPKLSVDVSVKNKKLEEDFYEVLLKTSIESDVEGKKFFIVELTYACVVNVKIAKEQLQEALAVAVPYQLFPFVRSTIANAMINSGLTPIMLPPIDFLGLYKEKSKAN